MCRQGAAFWGVGQRLIPLPAAIFESATMLAAGINQRSTINLAVVARDPQGDEIRMLDSYHAVALAFSNVYGLRDDAAKSKSRQVNYRGCSLQLKALGKKAADFFQRVKPASGAFRRRTVTVLAERPEAKSSAIGLSEDEMAVAMRVSLVMNLLSGFHEFLDYAGSGQRFHFDLNDHGGCVLPLSSDLRKARNALRNLAEKRELTGEEKEKLTRLESKESLRRLITQLQNFKNLDILGPLANFAAALLEYQVGGIPVSQWGTPNAGAHEKQFTAIMQNQLELQQCQDALNALFAQCRSLDGAGQALLEKLHDGGTELPEGFISGAAFKLPDKAQMPAFEVFLIKLERCLVGVTLPTIQKEGVEARRGKKLPPPIPPKDKAVLRAIQNMKQNRSEQSGFSPPPAMVLKPIRPMGAGASGEVGVSNTADVAAAASKGVRPEPPPRPSRVNASQINAAHMKQSAPPLPPKPKNPGSLPGG